MRLPRRLRAPSQLKPGSGRVLLLLALVTALLLPVLLLSPSARSQTTPPATTVPAPFPSPAPGVSITAPGAIGNSIPPQNIFFVSPVGCDPSPTSTLCPLPTTPSQQCAAVSPCATIDHALSQARDGDGISLTGGTYFVTNPIEVDRLVTIAPNAFFSAVTAITQQTVTQTGTCSVATLQCTVTLGVTVLAGSSISLVVTPAAPATSVTVIGSVAPLTPPGSSTGCPLTAPSAFPVTGAVVSLTFTCPAGTSIPATQALVLTLDSSTFVPPTVTASVTAPTISTRPVVQSCGTIIPPVPGTVSAPAVPAQCIGPGGAVFRITSVGSAALHTTVFGLTIGNAGNQTSAAAIILDNDSYTEIAKNVIGAQDLPDAIGILLSASDHPIIHDNTIQGSTLFPLTATLLVGQSPGGFGIATQECFGAVNHSNGVQLISNLFARNSNAGIWFCSDGTGGFLLANNTIRANGRGVVFSSAVDTYVSGNTIGDNILDGIDLLQASARNLITGNVVESQQSPDSVGVLLAGTGPAFPLGNRIELNQIHRNTVDVAIVGAQGTRFLNNSITAVGTNTGVLFSLAIPGWASGQPLNTSFAGNALQSTGGCAASNGCAIRLTTGVTVPIDASAGNDFGVSSFPAIQDQIWDHGRDPSLGIVYVQIGIPVPAPVPGILGVPLGSVTPPAVPVTATAGPPQVIGATSTPVSGAPQVIGSTSGTTVATATAGGTPVQQTAYFDPGSGTWYVVAALCTTDARGNPAANDLLTITFFGTNGSVIGSTQVTTGANGCFNGNIQPSGSGQLLTPAKLEITDSSGADIVLPVVTGSPSNRPPVGPVQ